MGAKVYSSVFRMCALCALFCKLIESYVHNTTRPPVLSIKLHLKQEEIPTLMAETIFGSDAMLRNHFRASKVSLADIISLVEPHQHSFKGAVKELDIKLTDLYELFASNNWTATVLQDLVATAGINVTDVYHSFKYKVLKNPEKDVPRILNALGIDANDFDKAVNLGAQKQIMEVLGTGRYSQNNIEMALEGFTADISLSDVLKLLHSVRFESVVIRLNNNFETRPVIDALKRLITSRSAAKLAKLLYLSASDFYGNQAFAELLKRITNLNEKVIGTAVSPNKIITFIYDNFLKNYTRLVAETFENSPTEYEIHQVAYEDRNLTSLVTAEDLKVKPARVSKRLEMKAFTSCIYLSKTSDNLLYMERVVPQLEENKVLSIIKTNATSFCLGSPLLCGDYLYGVANWDNEERVEFIPVYGGRSRSGQLNLRLSNFSDEL